MMITLKRRVGETRHEESPAWCEGIAGALSQTGGASQQSVWIRYNPRHVSVELRPFWQKMGGTANDFRP